MVSLEEFRARVGDGRGGRARRRPASDEPDPERLAASSELRRLLEAAVDALPEEFRTVFVLREVEGLSTAETAAWLAIRPETVKTRLHRARRLLQERLSERLLPLSPSLFEFQGRRCDRVVRPGAGPAAGTAAGRAMHAHPGRAGAPERPRWLGRLSAFLHEGGSDEAIACSEVRLRFALALGASRRQLRPAHAGPHAASMSPPAGYKKVSELVKLPDFLPGLGTLYVQPATLPAGPFLAYDRDGKLVSTIYMIPLEDMQAQKKFDELAVGPTRR